MLAIVRDLEYNIKNIGDYIMQYMTAKQASLEWNISQRRVSVLCSEGRIEGASRFGNMWSIPSEAEKPIDGRAFRYLNNIKIKPFIKWAGGKTQLINTIISKFPEGVGGPINKYAEPMVGGGALLFEILSKFSLQQIYISDSNVELINTFIIVKNEIDLLIDRLFHLQDDYKSLDEEGRKKYYYSKRNIYNELIAFGQKNDNLEKAALFIFLNKTCFNGLYRVNKKGQFNVPMGSYKNPLICDDKNLRNISDALQDVKIECGDYCKATDFIDNNTLVYIDPPYRPLNKTSEFTSYNENRFGDKEQIQLAEFAKTISAKGAKIILSNSDPKNIDENDNFFDKLYKEFNIERIEATRMINSKSQGRGKIKELLIKNY